MEIDRTLLRKYVLDNAVKYQGQPHLDSIVGKLVMDNPKYKKNIQELRLEVEKIVSEVSKMGFEKQKETLDELGGPVEREKENEKDMIPLLKVKHDFVVRFAPNPNGPMHLGHARQAVVNWIYRNIYKGIYILRFDDTDPKNKPPEKNAYKWMKEDLEWLGIKPDKVYYSSKRLSIYYKYFKKLIEMGKAYVCTCDQGQAKSSSCQGKICMASSGFRFCNR